MSHLHLTFSSSCDSLLLLYYCVYTQSDAPSHHPYVRSSTGLSYNVHCIHMWELKARRLVICRCKARLFVKCSKRGD